MSYDAPVPPMNTTMARGKRQAAPDIIVEEYTVPITLLNPDREYIAIRNIVLEVMRSF